LHFFFVPVTAFVSLHNQIASMCCVLCQYQRSAMRNMVKLDCKGLERISYIVVRSDFGMYQILV